jgi:hypothetical protein
MNRIEVLSDIIDLHIEVLKNKKEPFLNDTKTLTEILKSILVLEQIKNIEGRRSEYDSMTDEQIEDKIKDFE